MLKEYRGTVKRLEFEDQVLDQLDTGGALRADRYVRNREGSFCPSPGTGRAYVLKDLVLDRECDLKDNREIRLAPPGWPCCTKACAKCRFRRSEHGSI